MSFVDDEKRNALNNIDDKKKLCIQVTHARDNWGFRRFGKKIEESVKVKEDDHLS